MAQFPEIDDATLPHEEVNKDLPAGVRNRQSTRYAYFEMVSKGSHRIVKTCKDLHLSRRVCYKSLVPDLADDPEERRHFLREARITAMLEHPSIVPVYEINRDNRGHFYFTMPHVVGSTFDEMLDALQARNQTATTADLDEMVEVLIRVCEGLDFAHTSGVIHCNLNPQNIVVGHFGEVRILDWGAARLRDEPSESVPKSPLETLYMSPEQKAGGKVDFRSDVYSVGAIMFELLTMESFGWGTSLQRMLDVGALAPNEAPSKIEAICLQSVAKNPTHRFQSISELIQALRYWQRNEQQQFAPV